MKSTFLQSLAELEHNFWEDKIIKNIKMTKFNNTIFIFKKYNKYIDDKSGRKYKRLQASVLKKYYFK